MTYSVLLILSFLSAARAANDWTKPCVSGVCSYDLPSTNGSTSSGTMKIWGSKTAIGDITEAAGWKILGCSPDVLTQDIRLVCTGATSMCQHLYQGHGAVDTIVRLPESCGKGPFARVQKTWVPADQSIPASIAARIVRRDGSQPQVQAITLDTNFAAANNSNTGTVNLAIKGANVPGVNDILDGTPSASQRRSRLNRPQLRNFVTDAADSISNALSSVNTVSINKSKALPAADFSKKASLFEKSIDCPPITAEASVGIDATAHAVVTVGVAATGTIVPPKITDFSLLASLTADLNGELTLKAELSGTLDSGNIKLFEAGIPGVDFPGILSIGPTFVVNARGTATAELAADLTLGINYHVNNAKMAFPSGSQSGGAFSLGDTPLKLSADTKVEATTTVEAHLIPSINFGIEALDVATANVALSLDASATMVLKVEAKAGASATIQQANSKRQDDSFGDDEDSTDDSDDTNFSQDSGDEDSGSDDSTGDLDFSGDSGDQDSGSDDTTDSNVDPGSDDTADSDLDGSDDTPDDSSLDADSDDTTQDSSSDAGSDDTPDDSSFDTGSDDADSTLDPTSDDSSLDSDSDDSTTDSSLDAGSDDAADDSSLDTGSDDSTTDDESPDTGSNDSTDSSVDPSSDDTTSDDSSSDADSADTNNDDGSSDPDSADSTDSDSADDAGLDNANNSTSIDTGDSEDDSDLDSANNSTSIDTGDSADSGLDSADNSTSIDTGDNADSNNATTTATSEPTATSSSAPLVSATTAADASFGGSFVISGGLDLSASATGKFFGIFDASKKLSLFKKSFQLFSKTFGDEAGGDSADSAERRSLPTRPFRTRRVSRAQRFALESRGLACLAKAPETKDLADETVPGKGL